MTNICLVFTANYKITDESNLVKVHLRSGRKLPSCPLSFPQRYRSAVPSSFSPSVVSHRILRYKHTHKAWLITVSLIFKNLSPAIIALSKCSSLGRYFHSFLIDSCPNACCSWALTIFSISVFFLSSNDQLSTVLQRHLPFLFFSYLFCFLPCPHWATVFTAYV